MGALQKGFDGLAFGLTRCSANGLSPLQAASRYAGQMQKNARMREAIESAGGGDHKTVTKLLRKALAAHSKKNDKAGKAQPDREL
jgi:hypothetical protein